MDIVTANEINLTTDLVTESSSFSDLMPATSEETPITVNLHNVPVINASHQIHNESQFVHPLFEGFIVAEFLMTSLELVIAFVAAVKISGWKSNYRNQMLMQMSAARVVKRVFFYIQYLNEKGVIKWSSQLHVTLIFLQMYIDSVIVILVCFFIKHMYDSLITVLVKISRGSFYRTLTCSWLIPLPISALWTFIINAGLISEWSSYFVVYCVLRWPLMFFSTTLYIIVLYRVLREDIRKFARSLTVVTFCLCLIVNCYLLLKDIIYLWCIKSFSTILISYILGVFFNSLVLGLYVILIGLNYHSNQKQKNSYGERSIANVID